MSKSSSFRLYIDLFITATSALLSEMFLFQTHIKDVLNHTYLWIYVVPCKFFIVEIAEEYSNIFDLMM